PTLILERQNFPFGRAESNVGSATVSVGPEIIIAALLLVCVSALFFGLRIYSKVLRKTSLWWADHVLAAAWVTQLRAFQLVHPMPGTLLV
ncbi:hypothetical protein OFB79_25615, partial [Escherichia coli]|nr:hypothetical protein [Escherichia coli]